MPTPEQPEQPEQPDKPSNIPGVPNIIDGAIEGFDEWYEWARRHDPVILSAAKIAQSAMLSREDEYKFAIYFGALSAHQARRVVYSVVDRLGEDAVFGGK